jgi:peroxiredoxin
VDGVANHEGWSKDIEETQGVALNFPLIADADRKVANLYGMIHPNADNTMTVRSVFIIGPDKKLKLTLTYPASTGRNFNEILRVIDSLQLTANYKVATPADWQDGEDCIIVPAVSNEEADKLFDKGYKVIKPYLRTTPSPIAKRTDLLCKRPSNGDDDLQYIRAFRGDTHYESSDRKARKEKQCVLF